MYPLHLVLIDLCYDTDIQEKEQKESQIQQSQAREGKDQVKSKSKVIRLKKIQLEG
ncbi:hypothetical protein Tco_1281463, partial [Tanacetum coccineum]